MSGSTATVATPDIVPVVARIVVIPVATAVTTPFAVYRSARHFPRIRRFWLDFLALGAFAAISIHLSAVAYTLTLSSYVEAVKHVEIPMALVIGYFVFHEKARVRAIWPGSMVILAGAVIIRLWG